MKGLKNHTVTFLTLLVVFIGIMVIYLKGHSSTFDESLFDYSRVQEHTKIMTSDIANGRLTGSKGNAFVMSYVEDRFEDMGLLPMGEEGQYTQSFKTIVPQIDSEPEFTYTTSTGQEKSLEMYEDYNVLTYFNGGGIKYDGSLVFVGSNLYRIEAEIIRNKIIVIEAGQIQADKVQYVIEHGGRGILCAADEESYARPRLYELVKNVTTVARTGESILVGYLSKDAYRMMRDTIDGDLSVERNKPMGILDSVHIHTTIEFPVTETANIIGGIQEMESQGETLIIAADMDGVGSGIDGQYFQGATNGVSSVAVLLEIARVCSIQETRPDQEIIFLLFNGQSQQLSGSTAFLEEYGDSLSRTRFIHLGNLGQANIDGLMIGSDLYVSDIFASEFLNHAHSEGHRLRAGAVGMNPINSFVNYGMEAIAINDVTPGRQSYENTIETIDVEGVQKAADLVLTYVGRESYNDYSYDYLNGIERTIIGVLLVWSLIVYVVGRLFKTSPNIKVLGVTVEEVYYSRVMKTIRLVYGYVLTGCFAMLIIAIIANVDQNSTIRMINGRYVTNFSPYILIKDSILYFRTIFANEVTSLMEVIYSSSTRSILLITSSLILSMIVGIIRGMIGGIRSKKNQLDSMGMLILFSVPDVLIVMIGVYIYVYVTKNYPDISELLKLKAFTLPLLTLSVIPSIYIARISYVTIIEELKKDYVIASKASGMSRFRIITGEILPAVLYDVMDAMPTIMTMLISNMIIVEYLFNYIGITYFLLYFYDRRDVHSFIALAITLGFIYMVFSAGIKKLSRWVSPRKRRVS